MGEPDSVRDRAWLWPLVAALVAMTPHVLVVLGRSELFYDDHRRFTVPLGTLAAQAVCRGELPAWNPFVGLGVPLMADPQTLAMYPGLWLACVLPPSHALGLLFVLHLGVLAAGLTALLRAFDVRPAIALGVGAAAALCGPAPSWLTSGPYLVTLSFFPWVLLAAWRLGRGEAARIPAVLALGLALGMAVLGGDVPGALCQAVVALAFWASAGGRPRAFAPLAAAGALALLIGAATWAPLLWYVGRSVRAAGLSAAEAGRWSLHPAELLGLLVPHPTGLPLPENTFWPFGWVKQPRLFVHSYYLSALLAGFGVWGAWALRRERFVRVCAIAALALLLVATGSTTPLWAALGPLFKFLRYPSKVAPYALLLLAIIGGLALSRTLSQRGGARVAGVVAGLAALAALLLPPLQGWLARAAEAPPEQIAAAAEQLRGSGLAVAAFASLACAVLALGKRAPWLESHAPALLGAILIADAGTAGTRLWWTVPAPLVTPRPEWLSFPLGGPRVIRAGELDELNLHRDETGYLRDVLRNERLLQPNTNVLLRAGVLEGYGLALGDVFQGLGALYQADPTTLAELTATDFLLVPAYPIQRWVSMGLGTGRLQVVRTLPDAAAVVLRPRGSLPRWYTSTDFQLAARKDELPLLLSRAFAVGPIIRADEWLKDGARRETQVRLASPRSGPVESVAPVSSSPTTLRFQLDRAEPGLLVVNDAFADGWHASVDGIEVPIYRANLVARAIWVPAGPRVVALWFDVPAFRWAARAPWLGLALALGALVVELRRRRQAE